MSNNPSLSDEEATGLAWVGLQGTDTWNSLDEAIKTNSTNYNNIGRGTETSSLTTQMPCN